MDEQLDDYLKNEIITDIADEKSSEVVAVYTPERITRSYPIEPHGSTDSNVTADDMLTLISAEIKRKGIAGDHIASMNTFYSAGLHQIITQLFKAEFFNMENTRDKTDEDREIKSISASVEFTGVDMKPPTTFKYASRRQEMLIPNMARSKNLSYTAPLFISATITATALLRNGKTVVRQEHITQADAWKIADVPVMTGTKLDNLWRAPIDTLKALEEDPHDPQGSFIIKGTGWVVDKSENLVTNMCHGYKNKFGKEIARATFQSKPGDAYENSHYLVIKYLTDGQIVVQIVTNKFEHLEIPYFLIFRAFGMTCDRDIIENIVYDVEGTDLVTKYMLDVLERTFQAESKDFGPMLNVHDSDEILMFIATKMFDVARNPKLNRDANAVKYVHSKTFTLLDKFIFPHIGNSKESRISKLRFMGHLIHKLLLIEMGVLEGADRDSYHNKRVHSSGIAMGKTTKTQFNFGVVQEIKKKLMKAFQNTTFSKVQMAEEVKASVDANAFTRSLVQSIVTGEKTITVKRTEVTNRVSSQQLFHKNDINVYATLNNITTHGQSAAKATDRAQDMRMAHNTYYGYIGMAQSADTGEKVGMNKQMAIMASVSEASSSYVLKTYLLGDLDIMPLHTVPASDIKRKKLTKVFVNGDWIGLCADATAVAQKYRTARRREDINPFTTIAQEYLLRELYFWVDVGRLLRPLIIVYNNKEKFDDEHRKGNSSFKFAQWIKLTKDHIRGLRAGTITMDDLRKQRVIEYISPEESENLYTALSIDVLNEHASDFTHQYTHCDIQQAVFGIVELSAPNTNHTAASRITMFTNHKKQTCGWYALNWPYRIDKNMFLQYYCETPTVRAFTNTITYPNAQNVILAYMTSKGFGQEDSLEVNKSAIDLGLFNGSHFYYEMTNLENGESFGNPDYARTLDMKKEANYEYIDANGFIKEGTEVHKGYVLIVKRVKLKEPTDQYLFADRSIIYRLDEPAIVDRVIYPRNDDDVLIAKVKLRSPRPLRVGDKLCLTPDHDVLTASGWKSIARVEITDAIATYRTETNSVQYQCPTDVYAYSCDENIISIETDEVSLRATRNHRMYVRGIDDAQYQLVQAEQLMGKSVAYKRSGDYDDSRACNTPEGIPVASVRDWLAFLSVYIPFGRLVARTLDIDDPSGYTVVLSKSCSFWGTVTEICESLNFSMDQVNGDFYVVVGPRVYATLEQTVGSDPSCNRMPRYIFDMSISMAQMLVCFMLYNLQERRHAMSDGLIDDLMQLSVHAGTPLGFVRRGDSIAIVSSPEPKVDAGVQTEVHYVGNVHCVTVPTGIFYVRRNGKPVWTGNSSHAGCKGIAAMLTNRADMPYTENGTIPDVIINPHSVPTRMVIGQIIETMMAKLAILKGCLVDGTPFRKLDIDGAIAELEKTYGIKYGGHQRMFNGKTGNWYDSMIFIGPTSYQRLQKFVAGENYAMSTGPTCALTRQPLDGKVNNGGLRIGEMEKDVFCAHGIMRCLFEKFYRDSDGIELFICRLCGERATVNQRAGIYKCKRCKDNADIVNVPSSWVANLFFNEVNAMGVKTTFEVEPIGYSTYS